MFERHKYKQIEIHDHASLSDPDMVASEKYDGANFFLKINPDGTSNWISRRESVKGGYPDKTDRIPHLGELRFPLEYAGHVINVELIHTGTDPNAKDSHRTVSGILNSLPPRAIETQKLIGPVRAKMFDVISPKFATYQDKLDYLKKLQDVINKPDIFSVVKTYRGPEIQRLIATTKAEGKEGIIATSATKPEENNVRHKVKHKIQHNLKISRILQEVDIHGNLKPSMGAVEVTDASGRMVGKVGSGWSRAQRQEAWEKPSEYLGRLIQVESLGMAVNALRAPVYNGDADGGWDRVMSVEEPSTQEGSSAFVRTRLYSD